MLTPFTIVSPEFEPYYTEYMSKVHSHCKFYQYYNPRQISIQFDKIQEVTNEGTTVAYCRKTLNHWEIVIDRREWEGVSEQTRREIMVHELTHCVFLEPHSKDPNSFMYPTLRRLSTLELDYQLEEYLKHACGRAASR